MYLGTWVSVSVSELFCASAWRLPEDMNILMGLDFFRTVFMNARAVSVLSF